MADDMKVPRQQQLPPPQPLPTKEEYNLVKWLRRELNPVVTFAELRHEKAFARELLKAEDKFAGEGHPFLIGDVELLIRQRIRNGTVHIELPPDGNKNQIKASIAEKICNYLLRTADATDDEGQNFVDITYQIAEAEMSYQVDYDAFKMNVESVFRQYYPSQPLRRNGEGYMAPYFALVQSNGMGKTKLMYHFAQKHPKMRGDDDGGRKPAAVESSSPSAAWEAKLILCSSWSLRDTDSEKRAVYGGCFNPDVLHTINHFFTYNIAYSMVKRKLDLLLPRDHLRTTNDTVTTTAPRKIVLLFDGASALLSSTILEEEFPGCRTKIRHREYEALLFRLVRLWLTERRKYFQIVAVFAASDINLRNFRDLDERPTNGAFYPRGPEVFDDLVTLTTLGCLRNETPVVASERPQSEYYQAIPYGRPLFAKMHSHGQLTSLQLPTVASKMWTTGLASFRAEAWIPNYNWDDASCWSILGTRVQMGQPSKSSIARSLVFDGYTTLVPGTGGRTSSANADSAPRIRFGPDPVCARIAMGLMDEDWTFKIPTTSKLRTGTGSTKQWWAEKACKLFSKGLVLPEKDEGDFGKVMVALYLLFCADEERKLLNHDGGEGGQAIVHYYEGYHTFSVRLDRWVDRLVHGGNEVTKSVAGSLADDEAPSTRPTNDKDGTAEGRRREDDNEGDAFFFNAIQVYPNNDLFGNGDESWKELGNEDFLKHLYKAGVGCYTFAHCETIDMVFPLKRRSGGDHKQKSESYYPMAVSVQSASACVGLEGVKAMSNEAKAAKWKTGLCLLVMLCPMEAKKKLDTTDDEHRRLLLSSSVVQELQSDDRDGRVACKVLHVPSDDMFGLSKAFGDYLSSIAADAHPMKKKARNNEQGHGGK